MQGSDPGLTGVGVFVRVGAFAVSGWPDGVRAPGKAVRIRRDPVTVIGDETHGKPLACSPGRRGE